MTITLLTLAIGLAALLATGSDLRRRGGGRDATVVADPAAGFEADPGKPPPGA